MKQYDHAFTVAFSIQSNALNVENIPSQELRQAMIDRANALYSNNEFTEALGAPFDTTDNFEGYPVDVWQYEVAEGVTVLGYHEWASAKVQADVEASQAS